MSQEKLVEIQSWYIIWIGLKRLWNEIKKKKIINFNIFLFIHSFTLLYIIIHFFIDSMNILQSKHSFCVLSDEDMQYVKDKIKSPKATKILITIVKTYLTLIDFSIDTHQGLSDIELLLCGKSIPNISLIKYIVRLIININHIYNDSEDIIQSVGFRCFLFGTIYIDRLLNKRSGHKKRNGVLNVFNIHRLIFISTWMALRFTEDELPSIKNMSQISGLDLEQIFTIDLAFCQLMDYRFILDHERDKVFFTKYNIPKSTFINYYNSV